MTVAEIPVPVRRGRPTKRSNLQLDLHIERAESVEFAVRVRQGVDRIRSAALMGSTATVLNEAGKLGYHAERRLEQIGAVSR